MSKPKSSILRSNLTSKFEMDLMKSTGVKKKKFYSFIANSISPFTTNFCQCLSINKIEENTVREIARQFNTIEKSPS